MLPLCLAPYLYISLSLIFCCTIQRFFPKVVYLNAIDLICTQLNHIYTNYLHYCAYSCCVQIVHTFKKQSTHFNIDNWRYMNVHNLVLIRVTYSQLGGVLFNIRIKPCQIYDHIWIVFNTSINFCTNRVEWLNYLSGE